MSAALCDQQVCGPPHVRTNPALLPARTGLYGLPLFVFVAPFNNRDCVSPPMVESNGGSP